MMKTIHIINTNYSQNRYKPISHPSSLNSPNQLHNLAYKFFHCNIINETNILIDKYNDYSYILLTRPIGVHLSTSNRLLFAVVDITVTAFVLNGCTAIKLHVHLK